MPPEVVYHPRTREKELESYFGASEPVDEATRAHHDALIGPVRLVNVDSDRDYSSFVQLIRRILVHLTVSARYSTWTIGSDTMIVSILRRTRKGKVVWKGSVPKV
ncbi:hypothetical protein ARMSODRAFT_65177 [Armillaria solidipes]|uniref:Uncharacterized protein n=1 Tax=Armillaria solidipes TaxID=1076256 RepID=A0A2H3BJW1_9AGAR|nr:hypothetical protein ARMSODRAFT_65177 [Armillaria solidipes]